MEISVKSIINHTVFLVLAWDAAKKARLEPVNR